MPENTVDMVYVILMQLVSGLGFITLWNDHFNIQALIPSFEPSFTFDVGPFIEAIFDKFQFTTDMTETEIITPPNTPLTQEQINNDIILY